jgi:hypothetical protein
MNVYRTPDYRHLPKNVRIPAPSILDRINHKDVETYLWLFVQLTFSFLASYALTHFLVS